jgi:hypothetical protein
VEEARKDGVTRDPMLGAVYLSEYINRRNGGVLVTPWDVDELPDEYVTLYQALQRVDAQAKKKNALESMFTSFRRKHPTYRK